MPENEDFMQELQALMAACFHQGAVASGLAAAQAEVKEYEREAHEAAQHAGHHFFKIREMLNISDDPEEPPKEVN